MDFQNNYRPSFCKSSAMEMAALITGLLTIVSFLSFTIYFPFIFGSLSIVFAILSKGNATRMTTRVRVGFTCAVVGILVNLLLIVTCIYLYLAVPFVHDSVNELFEKQYGASFEEMLDDAMKGELPDGNWIIE